MRDDGLRDEEDLVQDFRNLFFDRLSATSKAFIKSEQQVDDTWMEIDDFLQFTLLEEIEVPDILLGATAASAAKFGDADLWKRTLIWIGKHLERNNAGVIGSPEPK